jgi:hypothetical protein
MVWGWMQGLQPCIRSLEKIVLLPLRYLPKNPAYSACLLTFSSTPTQARVINNDDPP